MTSSPTNLFGFNILFDWHAFSSFFTPVWIITFIKNRLLKILLVGKLPNHIAFIMDGNRRYARQNGMRVPEGHVSGSNTLFSIIQMCFTLGIREISVYAFSIENFQRPQEEVDALLALIQEKVEQTVSMNKNIKFRFVGNLDMLPESFYQAIAKVEADTNLPENIYVLNVCIAYTSQDEMRYSLFCIAVKREANVITRDQITEKEVAKSMYIGKSTQNLDVLIRTSGHTRLSDFMLWQSTSNCQIEFHDVLWPNFKFFHLFSILMWWSFKNEWGNNRTGLWTWNRCGSRATDIQQLPKPPTIASVTTVT